jgi:hypothetical protein
MPKAFRAAAQGRTDFQVPVVCISLPGQPVFMTVCASMEAIHITKEQVMEFFDLVPRGADVPFIALPL